MGGRHAATTQGFHWKEGVLLAVAHLGRLPLPISLRSPSPILAATFMPPRGLPTLVVLSLVASSSVASLSSASSCDGAAACASGIHGKILLVACGRARRPGFYRLASCLPLERRDVLVLLRMHLQQHEGQPV